MARHSDDQPFLGVKELAVAALGLLQSPAGGFEHLDQISDFQHSHDTVLRRVSDGLRAHLPEQFDASRPIRGSALPTPGRVVGHPENAEARCSLRFTGETPSGHAGYSWRE